MAHIYALEDPVSGLIRYVGKTVDPESRMRLHNLANKPYHSACWIRSLKRCGLKPRMIILESLPQTPVNGWKDAERFYLNYFRFLGFDLTNHIEGGLSGYTMSAESKLRCSKAQKGHKVTEEMRANMRASSWSRNPLLIDRMREEMKKARAKRIDTPEVCAKLSASIKESWRRRKLAAAS